MAATWILPDETSAIVVLDRLESDYALVPALWWFEVYNLLLIAERRKRISIPDTDVAQNFLASLAIETDNEVPGKDIFFLARKHDLSGYDASYLELALRSRLPLATLDKAIIKAAIKENVPLVAAS